MTLWEFLCVVAPHTKSASGDTMSDERAKEMGIIGFE